jgi:hypothetical protein
MLQQVRLRLPRPRLIGGDAASRAISAFTRQPDPWIVERTFAGLGRYRWLSKDYERLCATSEKVL